MDKFSDIEQQYDKIYRYCYFKLHNREAAEDVTQETFLRFLANDTYRDAGKVLQYLYSIARNLCINEYHRPQAEALPNEMETPFSEDELLSAITLQAALEGLDPEERELLLLRYANEVPVNVICRIFQLSRFAIYRKISRALKKLQSRLEDSL